MEGVCQKFKNFNWQGHRIHGEWCSEVSDCEEKTAYNPNNRKAIASVKTSKAIVAKAVDVAYESKHKLLGLSFEDKMAKRRNKHILRKAPNMAVYLLNKTIF